MIAAPKRPTKSLKYCYRVVVGLNSSSDEQGSLQEIVEGCLAGQFAQGSNIRGRLWKRLTYEGHKKEAAF
jgi:hypothetical protein